MTSARTKISLGFRRSELAREVRDQLLERGYRAELARNGASEKLLTVTAPALLRAEVTGLIWLGGGEKVR